MVTTINTSLYTNFHNKGSFFCTCIHFTLSLLHVFTIEILCIQILCTLWNYSFYFIYLYVIMIPDVVSFKYHIAHIQGCIHKFQDQVITKYMLTTINTQEATQRVMVAKLTRLTHKIVIQLHLEAQSCTICSSCSKWPVWKLLDTTLYIIHNNITSRMAHGYIKSENKYIHI
jgi:hypothetical protein